MSKKPKDNKLTDLFAELKTEYLASFDEKIQVIEQFWQKKDHKALANEFHKIKGTGLTYGVQEMTDIAEILEDLSHQSSKKLGFGIMIGIDLFKKVRSHHEAGSPCDLSRDKLFKVLRKIQDELEAA